MLPFKLSHYGAEELFSYCRNKNQFDVVMIENGEKGFFVRMNKKNWFNKFFNLSKLFIVEKDDKNEFYFHPNTNLIYELKIRGLIELMKVIENCLEEER
ncbi:MAG: hypothetical protein ACTSVV_03965 [Promethearchaeota archaeon]